MGVFGCIVTLSRRNRRWIEVKVHSFDRTLRLRNNQKNVWGGLGLGEHIGGKEEAFLFLVNKVFQKNHVAFFLQVLSFC